MTDEEQMILDKEPVKKSNIPKIVGILNIVSDVFMILTIFLIAFSTCVVMSNPSNANFEGYNPFIPLGVFVLGNIAFGGGVKTIRDNSYKWALASSICAIGAHLGIISLILTHKYSDDFCYLD